MIYTLCGAVPFIGAAMAGTEPKGVDVEINAPRDCGPDGHFLARPGRPALPVRLRPVPVPSRRR